MPVFEHRRNHQHIAVCEHTRPYSKHFNGHFPGEPGLAGVCWSKGWW